MHEIDRVLRLRSFFKFDDRPLRSFLCRQCYVRHSTKVSTNFAKMRLSDLLSQIGEQNLGCSASNIVRG